MRIEEKTRAEIDRKLKSMGDYVKMDYLSHCLEKSLDFETKKFVLLTLEGIYEEKKMFGEAGRLLRIAADISSTNQSRIIDFIKSAELFIKAGNFEEADVSFKKALSCGSELEKDRIKNSVKEFYKTQARFYLKKDKRKHALDIYERLIGNFELNIDERIFIKEQIFELYSKLGKIKEMNSFKK